jgi:hypothetical protein
MTIHLTKQPKAQTAGQQLNDTTVFLARARNGEIPVTALRNIRLDQREVSAFLSKELLFWSSAAEGAKMQLVSILFSELHKSLLANSARKQLAK